MSTTLQVGELRLPAGGHPCSSSNTGKSGGHVGRSPDPSASSPAHPPPAFLPGGEAAGAPVGDTRTSSKLSIMKKMLG